MNQFNPVDFAEWAISQHRKIDPVKTHELGGRTYTTGKYSRLVEPEVSPLSLTSLTSLRDYLLFAGEVEAENTLIHIVGHNVVSVRSKLFGEFKQRETCIRCEYDAPDHYFDRPVSFEQAIVWLQYGFTNNQHAALLKKNIRPGH